MLRLSCTRLSAATSAVAGFRLRALATVAANIQDVTTADFESKVLHSKTPVIVDFHASWCGPCRQLGPRLEKAVTASNGALALAKVDVDAEGDLSFKYGVSSIPAVMGFKDGKIVTKFIGNVNEAQLEKFLAELQKK